MPAEMTLFSAMQKKLLDKQAELDRICGARYAEPRATLFSRITEDLPRYQLYTETVATLILDIGAQQASLMQKIKMREQLSFQDQTPASKVSPLKVEQTKQDKPKKEKPKVEAGKSIWATLAFIGSVFSRDPATSFAAHSSSSRPSVSRK